MLLSGFGGGDGGNQAFRQIMAKGSGFRFILWIVGSIRIAPFLNEYYSIAVSDHTIIDKENAFVEEIYKSDMTDSIEILNWYRNLYYTERLNTERGIVAMAINDLFMKYKDALR